MPVIAGAMSRNGADLPRWLRNSLLSNISRHVGDVARMFEGKHWCLATVETTAFGRGEPSFGVAGGPALVMAGEPLFEASGDGRSGERQDNTVLLYEDLCRDQTTALRSSTGVFCAAFFAPTTRRLTLIADKLGLRPIYYRVTPDLVVFASALRMLEAVGVTRTALEERGTYETCAFGFPLSTRTCYDQVRTIAPAEIVHVSPETEVHERYFRWDLLEDDDADDEAALVGRLADAFVSAVRRRLRGDKAALAFLSGGLDSRAIVATLRRNDVKVSTVNFAPPETQDRVFANLTASVLGSNHHQLEVPLSAASDVYRQTELQRWVDGMPESETKPERPRCIWSGDGGSVAMGHVYLDHDTVDTFDKGDLEAGIHSFLRYNRLPGASNAAMTPEFRQRSSNWHVDGMRCEIEALAREADGRALRLFLMFNDQRRHMAKHFENIDVHRFEFQLPFFDSHFLEVILRAPVRPFLRHALYHKWLALLCPAAITVPWQAYPNHIACPIAFDGELRYQWGDYFGKAEDRRLARRQGRDALRELFSANFPSHLISRAGYAPAIATCLMGFTKFSHVVKVGSTFSKYWRQSRVGTATVDRLMPTQAVDLNASRQS